MRNAVNLATSPFVSYRGFALTTALLAAVALAVTVWLGVAGLAVWRQTADTRTRLGELRDRSEQLTDEQKELETELQAPETRAVLDRAQFFNQLIEHKRLSWTQLFLDLQKRLPGQVRILSLAPRLRDDGRMQVEMRVGGASAGALIQFVRALEEDSTFREVELRSQSREGTSGDELVAQVRAVYARE